MKFSEKELVDELICDVIHNTRKRDEIIEDITKKQAYKLIEKYDGFDRILLTFPKHLLRDKNFIMNCEKNYGTDTLLYVDKSLFADVEYVLNKIGKDKYIYGKLLENYEILPKEEKYFIPVIKSSIDCELYKEIGGIIDKILENNDLTSLSNELTEINKNLKILTNKSSSLIARIIKLGIEKSVKKQVKKLYDESKIESKNLQA
ncbi:MAG: hypothetical protein IKA36_00720 [Clostridia bacterium]|nr:hypothetical protein [Clostridia bacterium]